MSSLEAFAPIALVARPSDRARAPAPGRAEEMPELHTAPRLSQHTETFQGFAAYVTCEPTVCTICRQNSLFFPCNTKTGGTKTGSNHHGKTHAPGNYTAHHALDAHVDAPKTSLSRSLPYFCRNHVFPTYSCAAQNQNCQSKIGGTAGQKPRRQANSKPEKPLGSDLSRCSPCAPLTLDYGPPHPYRIEAAVPSRRLFIFNSCQFVW